LTRDDFGETGVATSFIVVVASFGEVLKGMTDLDATLVKGVAGLDATLLKGATGLDGTLLKGVAGLDATLLKGVAGLDATLLKGVAGLDATLLKGVAGLDATLFGVTEHDLETSFGFTILFKVIISESACIVFGNLELLRGLSSSFISDSSLFTVETLLLLWIWMLRRGVLPIVADLKIGISTTTTFIEFGLWIRSY
jgi:hypothetical protein